MYWVILIAFILGMGVGVALSRSGRVGEEFDPKGGNDNEAESKVNPFLDEADSEVADDLRADGAQAVQNRIEKRKDKILTKAKAEGRITNDGVEELFCISDRTAANYLSQLVTENRLAKVGTTGRGVYYEPV